MRVPVVAVGRGRRDQVREARTEDPDRDDTEHRDQPRRRSQDAPDCATPLTRFERHRNADGHGRRRSPYGSRPRPRTNDRDFGVVSLVSAAAPGPRGESCEHADDNDAGRRARRPARARRHRSPGGARRPEPMPSGMSGDANHAPTTPTIAPAHRHRNERQPQRAARRLAACTPSPAQAQAPRAEPSTNRRSAIDDHHDPGQRDHDDARTSKSALAEDVDRLLHRPFGLEGGCTWNSPDLAEWRDELRAPLARMRARATSRYAHQEHDLSEGPDLIVVPPHELSGSCTARHRRCPGSDRSCGSRVIPTTRNGTLGPSAFSRKGAIRLRPHRSGPACTRAG